ncbi:MAG: hypothetical protein GX550_03060, partial [Syntrophomonadaceae bacterium]|nr:hypothetical protein [Syntrophomonadaceae bacterium]
MYTISQISKIYNISYLQVHELIDYGFLTVSAIERNRNKGIVYLFSEQELAKLDIPSLLAEIQDIKSK